MLDATLYVVNDGRSQLLARKTGVPADAKGNVYIEDFDGYNLRKVSTAALQAISQREARQKGLLVERWELERRERELIKSRREAAKARRNNDNDD